MGTHSYPELVFEPHNQKDAASDFAKAQGYQSNVGYNAREIRRWAGRLKAVKPKPQEHKPQGFK